MIAVDAARRIIQEHARPLAPERIALSAALGRVLREEVRCREDSPPFDASAMDGYAARRASLAGPLRLIGQSAAGTPFPGTVGVGECVRIFTGAPVPPGADCVIKQEDVARDSDTIRVLQPDSRNYIRRRGENRKAGELLLAAGSRLGAPEIAALAAAGVVQPLVGAAPRVAHLLLGDEIVAPETTPVGAQIRDSNSSLVAALLATRRCRLVAQGRVPDNLAAAEAEAAALPEHDLLLVSGGASVGDRDFARPLLAALGFRPAFDSVNVRPGKPLIFSTRSDRLAFALPGNPVSHWVVFHLFVAPLLDQLEAGTIPAFPRLLGKLVAVRQHPPADSRPTFWPAHFSAAEDGFAVELLPVASSGDGLGLVGANALLPVPAVTATLAVGQLVEFIPCP